jgi:hypothetical protein
MYGLEDFQDFKGQAVNSERQKVNGNRFGLADEYRSLRLSKGQPCA